MLYVGTQDFDDDLEAAVQFRDMDLGNGCGGKCLGIELGEDLIGRLAVSVLNRLQGQVAGKRRDLVLQLGQLGADVFGQQILAGRYRLTEFDVDRAEFLERLANALAARRRGTLSTPVGRPQVKQETQRTEQVGR